MRAPENRVVRDLVVALYAEGVPVRRIAGLARCCAGSVCNWARAAGHAYRPRRGPPDAGMHGQQMAHVRAAIAAAYDRGEKREAIAALYCCSASTVSNIARRAGHPPRRTMRLPVPDAVSARVLDLYAAGERVAAIKAATGVGFTRMVSLAEAAGLPPRPTGRKRGRTGQGGGQPPASGASEARAA